MTRFAAAAAVAGLALVAHLYVLQLPAVDTWAALLTYAVVCELYVFLFTMIMSSVSVGLLRALQAGSLSEADIEKRYTASAMVHLRLERLVASGLLDEDLAGFRPTTRGDRLLRFFGALRSIFRLRRFRES